jgi:glycosyltransferase involved in cell wall biosynthesis
MPELISIVVPAYNHGSFVEEALDSALRQTYSATEIIVVDDGSTDDTASKIDKIARAEPDRIRLIVQRNGGAHAAINRGLQSARGAWFTILNSDDSYDETRIEKLVSACRIRGRNWAFSRVGVIGSDVSESAKREGQEYIERIQHALRQWPTVGFSLLNQNVTISTGNLFFSRSLYERVGEFKPLQYVHDWDYALRLLLQEEPHYVDQVLYRYRLHATNSFHFLNDVAGRETSYVMRKFYWAGCKGPPNTEAPSPVNWPGFFQSTIQRLGHSVYLPSRIERKFQIQPPFSSRSNVETDESFADR